MFYFLLLLSIPVLEIMTFIEVGGEIGVLNTILLCIATAGLGITLIARQGIRTLQSARLRMEEGEAPLGEMFDGLCLFAAGVLLLIPGFVTDSFGFILLLPFVRTLMKARIATMPGVFMHSSNFSSAEMFRMEREADARQNRHENRSGDGRIIEGDYVDLTEDIEDPESGDKGKNR